MAMIATERELRYEKDCYCRGARATSGAVRIKVDEGLLRMRVTLVAGPSCDACGKPWRKEGE
jgi:hypothetical protein